MKCDADASSDTSPPTRMAIREVPVTVLLRETVMLVSSDLRTLSLTIPPHGEAGTEMPRGTAGRASVPYDQAGTVRSFQPMSTVFESRRWQKHHLFILFYLPCSFFFLHRSRRPRSVSAAMRGSRKSPANRTRQNCS